MEPTYSEATVLWRLTAPDGTQAHATFIPGLPRGTLVWFVGDTLDRAENFEDWAVALTRAEQVRQELLAAGWRQDGPR